MAYNSKVRIFRCDMKFLKKIFTIILVAIISVTSFGCEGFSLNLFSNATDYTTLINTVSLETMKSVITVYTEVTTLQGTTKYLGSGVIVKIEENTFNGNTGVYDCYALTNNHVVYTGSSMMMSVNYYVTDYQGNRYDLTYKKNDYDDIIKTSASDDLALIHFTASKQENNELKALPLAEKNSNIGGRVIAIGNPHGQKNTVTLGAITRYDTITMGEENDENSSNVTYEVIHHTCPIDSGSSGGVLINFDYEIVGINFAAGLSEETGEFISAYAIPIEKVISFLGNTLK